MKKIYMFNFILILLICCQTSGVIEKADEEKIEGEPIKKVEVTTEYLKYIKEKMELDCLQSIISLQKLDDFDLKPEEKKQKAELFKKNISLIARKSKELFVESKYEEALKYALSLLNMEQEQEILVPISDILDEIISILQKEHGDLVSNMYRKRKIRLGYDTEEDIQIYLQWLLEQNSLSAFDFFYEKYKEKYPGLVSDELNLAEKRKNRQNLTMNEVLNSSVRIDVDKGTKIEQGYTIPDRMFGSGFYINNSGYLLTNHHVIESEVNPEYEGYSRVYIVRRGNDKEKIPAKVIGYDKVFDVALIKTSKTSKHFLSGGNTKNILIGDEVLAVGAPITLSHTVTKGIISNDSRRFFQLGRTYQIDVAINPGNSGGALINRKNEVVGITFASLPQFQGLNFAIPYYLIENMIPELFKGGKVERPWLGMAINDEDKTIKIMYVYPGSQSGELGIKKDDIILSINNNKLESIEKLQDYLMLYQPDTIVRMKIKRGKEIFSRFIRLSTRPYRPIEYVWNKDIRERLIYPVYGMDLAFEEQNGFLKKYIVNKILKGSVAFEAGVNEGDPVTIYSFRMDKKNNVLLLKLGFKKKNLGFIPSSLILPAWMDLNNFI